ncbi:MAG: YceG family protein [Ruminococcus sp.]|nr:YceG family protein [Ruminococcus sp.]
MNFNDFLGNKREYCYGKITNITPSTESFLNDYRTEAVKYGTVLENGIPNPDTKNIQYCNQVISADFQNDVKYIKTEMKKLLDGANSGALTFLAQSIYNEFCILKQNGKNDNVLRNTFIKFMCWFKFDFSNTMYYLNSPFVPKVLYYGTVKHYEALFMKILHKAGCFIVVVQNGGDSAEISDVSEIQFNGYTSSASKSAPVSRTSPAPVSALHVKNEDIKIQAKWHSCTNIWTIQTSMDNITKKSRGNDSTIYYNCFIQINGVNSKADYLSSLIQMYKAVKSRNHVIVNKEIPLPDNNETSKFRVMSHDNILSVIKELAGFIPENSDINRQIKSVFIDFLIDESQKANVNASVIRNSGIYLLCYLERYKEILFRNWKYPDIAVFIFMGAVKNKKTAMFLNFLAELPVDVLVLRPDLSTESLLDGKMLAEINYVDSLVVDSFPNENTRISIGTTAYHAEQEINQIMSENSVAFTNRQHKKAVAVCLRTMYEEIEQLWQEELKFRPNFSADDESVVMPVIFTKVSGVKDGDVTQYWRDIKRLVTEETFLIRKVPFMKPLQNNQMNWSFSTNGKICREVIKSHASYRYGMLRNEIQEHIFDCMQRVLDSKMIKNVSEQKIVGVILNIDMTFINMIQNIDFTKKNPKVVCIITNENAVSEEDAVMLAFLSTTGFDVVFFVPTGYQTAEKYYIDGVVNEHQNGEYIYNLSVPDFHVKSANPKLTLKERLFGRK